MNIARECQKHKDEAPGFACVDCIADRDRDENAIRSDLLSTAYSLYKAAADPSVSHLRLEPLVERINELAEKIR